MQSISSGSILETLKKLALLNAAYLLLMTVFRGIFHFYYSPGDLGGWHSIAKAYFFGIRFDLVIVAYINGIVTLSFLAVWAVGRGALFRKWLSFIKYYYAAMFSVVFILLCVDFGFYSYFKNHMNALMFGILEDDTAALFSTLAENYNLLLVGCGFAALIGAVYLVARFFVHAIPAAGERSAVRFRWWQNVVLALLLVTLNVLAARGSFNLFPLGVMDAEISSNAFINKLCINGIFTLQEAVEARLSEKKDYNVVRLAGYENHIEQAFSDYCGRACAPAFTSLAVRTKKNPFLEKNPPNVIVIMMEGFGSDLARYHSSEFNVLGELKKHFDEDYVFYNFISGDVGTIGSVETALTGLPKRPEAKCISQSQYAFRDYPSGAAVPYRKAGYDTLYVYGGNMGWRNTSALMTHLGFAKEAGEGSMDPGYPRNQWGVYDEYLFDYLYRQLEVKDGKPKFIFAMTTTNHPPYSLPKDYTSLPLEVSGDLQKRITGDRALAAERFKTYQYSCQKVGEFISRIKASPFGKNTIVAITGDHNFWSVFDYNREDMIGVDGVPFYLYVPKGLRPSQSVDTTAYGSQVDIMPTLYHLSLSDAEYISLGSNLMDAGTPHIAYNVDGIILSKEGAVRHTLGTGQTSFYNWGADGKAVETAAAELHKKLVQHFKAAVAVTDYLIRTPEKTDNKVVAR
jgi:phosphoglycerol transferase MdoB-like AlkP superfamily enzyme